MTKHKLTLFSIALVVTAVATGYIVKSTPQEKQPEALLHTTHAKPVVQESTHTAKSVSAQKNQRSKFTPQNANAWLPDGSFEQFTANGSVQEIPDAKDKLANKSAGELMALVEAKSAQGQVQDSAEFKKLIDMIGNDLSARKQVIERLLNASGTPYGDALSLALGMSASIEELPEVKYAALQLLQKGNSGQQVNALQLLARTNSQDSETRATVLDLLRREGRYNPKLAIAALETFNQKGEVSPVQQQEVVDTLAPFLHSDDMQLRVSSLEAMAQWGGQDATALRALTEAVNDPEPGIRSIALSALGGGKFPFDVVRESLLTALSNPNEDLNVRYAAMQVMQEYPLDEEALKVYQNSTNDLQQESKITGFN